MGDGKPAFPAAGAPASKLAARREERKLARWELASQIGVSESTLQRLELGSTPNPPLRYLTNAAIVLGVQLEDLIEDEWRTWFPLKGAPPPVGHP